MPHANRKKIRDPRRIAKTWRFAIKDGPVFAFVTTWPFRRKDPKTGKQAQIRKMLVARLDDGTAMKGIQAK